MSLSWTYHETVTVVFTETLLKQPLFASFELEIVKKNQTHISDEFEEKMLSLFTLGNSYSQIADHIEDMYGVHFFKPAITAVTDKLISKLEELRKRPLESIYPFLYLDVIDYKVREEGTYISKAFYTVLGVDSIK